MSNLDSTRFEINISGSSHLYKTVGEYDSIQKALPSAERDGWWMSRLVRKRGHVSSANTATAIHMQECKKTGG